MILFSFSILSYFFNKSLIWINLYLNSANSQQKSSQDTFQFEQGPYSLINLFTETQHFPYEQSLGDGGEKKTAF